MTFDIIYVRDLEQTLREKDAVIIDIRTKEEYGREHWSGAINIPLNDIELYENLLDKQRYNILYCQHGGNSMKLARYLGRRGYRTGSVVGGYEVMKKFLENYFKK